KRSEGPACSLNELWQQSNSSHGRTVPIPVPPSSLRRRSAGTFLARKVARKLARRNFQKTQENTQTGTQNTLFFSEDPNVDFLSGVAQASCLPVQRLPASSTQPSTLNPEIPQPIRARSA